jgi:RNA polymerase sigma-70 factor (ECF subfamily)
LEGSSYAEIAQILDLPEGTVKTHLFRAREALKKAMLDKYQQGEI